MTLEELEASPKEMLDWIRERVYSAKLANSSDSDKCISGRELICEAYGMAEAAHAMRLITDAEFLEVYDVYLEMMTAETPEVVNGIRVA